MSSQIQITGETKVKSLTGVLVGTSGVVSSLNIDGSLGIPQLDVNGKILVSQLPNSVMEYKGTWDASTNTPTLVNGTGNQGDVYLCNVAGTVNFGAGAISFVVSDQVIYSGSIWQKASGSNGTVTSVAASITGNSLGITGSPITTAGTLAFAFAGTNLQYVNGAGDLTTFPTLITSIGLSMPSAFSVANSPLTANGTIAVTGAGVASQYIRGDGTLANFPTSGGGGSSVAYYFNSSVSQGTLGGVAYRELSKVPIIGAGTDITIATNGYIANYITDAGDPSLLEIPAGNWNFEMFFSASSGGGSPSFYVELYKYDGTTFTLISSSSATPEGITNGTAIDLYTTALAVPLTTLTLTDRLAIKVYVNNSGRTITLHTENSHLCEVITTFSTGIAALNGLTAQVQYFQTGTSGTDFAISSATATHTFNLPVASASNTGKLSSTDWSTFNNKASTADLANYLLLAGGTLTGALGGTSALFTGNLRTDTGLGIKYGSFVSTSGYLNLFAAISGSTMTLNIKDGTGGFESALQFNNTANRSYAFPNADGTVALLESTQTFTGTNTFTQNLKLDGNGSNAGTLLLKSNSALPTAIGYTGINSTSNQIYLTTFVSATKTAALDLSGLSDNIIRTFTFPNATGTLALTSDLSGFVTSVTGTSPIVSSGGTTPAISIPVATTSVNGYLSSADWTTFNSKQGTITLTTTGSSGAATFSANTLNIPNYGSALSGYIPYTGTGITVFGLSAIGEYDGGAQIPAGYGGNYALTLGNGLIGNGLSLYTSGSINAGAITTAGFSRVTNATASTSTTTGAFVVTGGVGIGGALYGTSATFNSNIYTLGQLHVPNNSTGTSGGIYFDYNANVASRTWQIVTDYDAYGDFQIRQSTTQTGSTYSKILGFSPTGAATFSSSVTATSLIASSSLDGDPVLATFTNVNAGTSAEATIYVRNGTTSNDATFLQTTGTGFTTTGGFVQDGGTLGTGTGLSGGLSLIVRANADMRFYTNGHTNERMRITSGGNFDYGGYNIQSSNNTTYRQAFYGGLSIMWRGAEDAYIDSNHTYSSTGTNVASYTSANGIGRMTITGGTFDWATYNGSVTAGTAYALTSRFTITSTGNVGIGTSTPNTVAGYRCLQIAGETTGALLEMWANSARQLQINANTTDIQFYGAQNVPMIFYTNTTERMRITSGGGVSMPTVYSTYSTGNAANLYMGAGGALYVYTSSIKYKKDIRNYDKGLAEVLKMRPVYYKGISEYDGDTQFAGLIAEEIQELGLTEFVQYEEDGSPRSLAYASMVTLLIKAIQEQQVQIEELKAKIK